MSRAGGGFGSSARSGSGGFGSAGPSSGGSGGGGGMSSGGMSSGGGGGGGRMSSGGGGYHPSPSHYGSNHHYYYNYDETYWPSTHYFNYNPYWSSYYLDSPNSNNNVRKVICDRSCDTKIPKYLDGSGNAQCKLVCYQASDVLVSGKTLCETDCKINGVRGKGSVEACAEATCGPIANDYRAIYTPRKLT